jgi:hypothetical protein
MIILYPRALPAAYEVDHFEAHHYFALLLQRFDEGVKRLLKWRTSYSSMAMVPNSRTPRWPCGLQSGDVRGRQ